MKVSLYTDLASELTGAAGAPRPCTLKLSEIVLDKEQAARYRKAEGKYVTAETDVLTGGADERKRHRLAVALADVMRAMLPDAGKVLIVGLGNAGLTADALGGRVCAGIPAGGRAMTLVPGVFGMTGVESFDVVKGVTERTRPAAIVAVDSLAAASTQRVGRVVQISDAGITPGSGVSNHRGRLGRETLGVPVISVGVPLVVYASTIIRDAGGDESGFESLIVTPKDIDVIVAESAEVIARSILRAL